MKIKKHIPNFITCLNLLCGFLGIICALQPHTQSQGIFNQSLVTASCFIFLAAFFDFIDGFAARLLKVSSPIGKELDSLADIVSFGVLPGIILWQLFKASFYYSGQEASYLIFLSLLLPVFSALRLAKFNIDTRQHYGFLGLPTPASAIVFASFPLMLEQTNFQPILLNIYFISIVAILIPALLVLEIPLMAFKFKGFGWKENKVKYIFLLVSVCLILFLSYFTVPFVAIPLIVALYIIVSILNKTFENSSGAN